MDAADKGYAPDMGRTTRRSGMNVSNQDGSRGTPRPYKVKEFADLADLSLNAVYELVRRGEIPAVRFGRAIRLPREACDRLLTCDAKAA